MNKILYGHVTIFHAASAFGLFIIVLLVANGITLYLRRSLRERIPRDTLEIITKLVYYGIIIIVAIPIMGLLGVNLSGLLVAGGIMGIVIGFASQSIVGNLISGLFLMAERPVKIGDTVSIDGNSGTVQDIRIISTTISTFDGVLVRIPNEKVFTSSITNYVTNFVRRFEYVIGIRYSDDALKAIEIINQIGEEHSLVLKNPPMQVFVDNLGDNSVNIIVRMWSPASDWYGVKTELLLKMKMELEKNGIQIPFPQRVVWQGKDSD